MHPISPAHPALPTLFDTPYLNFVIKAMEVGNSPALAWVDDTHMPTSALIWDKTHSLYLGGDANNETFNQTLREFFSESLIPKVQQDQLSILKLYFANENWHSEAASLLPDITLQERARVLYRFDTHIEPPPSLILPPQMELRLIDEELLQNQNLPGINMITEEIESCWTSLEHFIDQGFGYCIIDETAGIVSWCTAEYVSPGICGVGIETVEVYQWRNLATTTASAFAQHAARLGWQVNWDSWLSNTPSIRVAEKAGFQKVTEYQISVAVLE